MGYSLRYGAKKGIMRALRFHLTISVFLTPCSTVLAKKQVQRALTVGSIQCVITK